MPRSSEAFASFSRFSVVPCDAPRAPLGESFAHLNCHASIFSHFRGLVSVRSCAFQIKFPVPKKRPRRIRISILSSPSLSLPLKQSPILLLDFIFFELVPGTRSSPHRFLRDEIGFPLIFFSPDFPSCSSRFPLTPLQLVFLVIF